MEEIDNTAETSNPERVSILQRIKNAPKRTKLIAAGVTGALLVSGGIGAYAIYQSPDTVIAQAIVSLATTSNPSIELDLTGNASGVDGTLQILTYQSDKGSAIELNVKGKVAAQDIGVTLNSVFDKNGDSYLNLANFDSLASLLATTGTLPSSAIPTLKTALTGTWVKISSADLGQTTPALGGVGSCLNQTPAKQIADDLQSSIRSNFFIKVQQELPQEDGNRVFLLTLDAGKLRSFFSSFRTSKGFMELAKCEPGLSISDQALSGITQQVIDNAQKSAGLTVKLYATAMDHKLTKISFDVKNAGTGQAINLTLKPNGSHPEKVVIPTESVSYTQLLATLYASVLGSSTY
jgi:hypothetical protein